jgi:outer membrane protein assembly factor BamA
MFYYGIGPDASGDNHAVVDAFTVAIKQRVLRRVIKNVFAGPEIDFQNTSSVRFNQPEVNPFELPRGSTGSTNIGLGGALVYDNRHNVLNVRKGMFGEVSFLHYNPSLGSSFQYNSINVDLRSFYPVGKRNVLAWQVLGNFQSGEIPFNQLAMMGGEMMMRGYYQGRYRDKNMIAAQTEFRMLPFAFHKRLGGSVFASTAMVAPKVSSFTTNNLKLAGGFGLRYLLFPKKDIYLRLDIGFSKEGSSFYILNGEAF